MVSVHLPVLGQQHTDGNADTVLRGGGGVNPTTLGLELNIPLGNYPGRGIDVPISINYSSKVWRTEYITMQSRVNNPESCISINTLKYSERSAAGWTSSLEVPYIEYTGAENLYSEKGFAISDECQTSTSDSGGTLRNAYVKRITAHLPGGVSHDLRAGDEVFIYSPTNPAPFDFNGTFKASDSSNTKYIEDSASGTFKLLLPDGSFYLFSTSRQLLSGPRSPFVRKAVSYTDSNGNSITYDATARTLTDTIGRVFGSPFLFEPPAAPTSNSSPQEFNLPGINGAPVTYKFHWKRLNGGTQSESAMTDISDPAYQIKYKADRASPSPYDPVRQPGTYLFGSEWEAWVHDQGEGLFNPVVLTKIELPTGAAYEFKYDNLGRIERVVYPTGGEEHYQYGVVPTLSKSDPGEVATKTNFGVRVRKAFVAPGSRDPYVWTYDAAVMEPSGYRVTTVNPQNIRTERFLYRSDDQYPSPNFGTFGFEKALSGMEYENRVFDKNNKLVRRDLNYWTKSSRRIPNAPNAEQRAERNPRLVLSERYVYDPRNGDGLKTKQGFTYAFESELDEDQTPVLQNGTFTYGYEAANNAVTVPAFGAEPDPLPPNPEFPSTTNLIRYGKVTYLIYDPEISSQARQLYRDRNLIDLRTVKERFDNAGRLVTRSITVYDQPGASAPVRGNQTEIRKWDSSLGSPSEENSYASVKSVYDDYGNKVAQVDPLGNESRLFYDPVFSAFVVKTEGPVPDADGSHGANESFVSESVVDPSSGLPISTTGPNGIVNRFEYEAGTLRLKRRGQYLGNAKVGPDAETLYNDEPGNFWIMSRKQIDQNNWASTTNYFDGLGRLIRSELGNSGGNILVDKEYDAEGRVLRASAPYRDGGLPRWTTNEYDDAGRVIRVTGPDGSKVSIDHGILVSDRKGTTKTITDQAGRKRTGVTDAIGRMFRVVEDPEGENLITEYLFDANGRIRETVQGDQHRYFMFDSLGRLKFSKQPEQDVNPELDAVDPVSGNSVWAQGFEHDLNSNVVRSTDPRNVTLEVEYDALNRPVRRNFSDGTPPAIFYYDGKGVPGNPDRAKGKLTRAMNSVSDTLFLTFDELGRVRAHEQSTGGKIYRTAYEYDLGGKLVAEVYPSGRRMEYGFDEDGELGNVSGTKSGINGAKLYMNNFEYTPSGEVEKVRLGNGRWQSAGFNSRDQISEINLGYSEDENSLLQLKYGYGGSANNGSLRSQTIAFDGLAQDIAQNYEYDALNRVRLVSESVGSNLNWLESFAYDRYGNRIYEEELTTTISQFDKTSNPSFDPSTNRLIEEQDGDRIPDYVFDGAGNLTRDADNKRFVYNGENQLASFFRGNNSTTTPDAKYEYDGEGRRVRKRSDGIETVFVYNAFGKLIAEYSDKLPESPKIRYLTRDSLGSTRVVTDGAGTVVSRNDFMAFGESLSDKIGNVSGREASHGYGSPQDLRNQFTGYERDIESGLDFAQMRYYDSAMGRYTSVDPLNASANLRNPQTFNRYSYVLNSPYKFVDPLGLISQSTGACGQFCTNSETVGVNKFDDMGDRGGPLAWRINAMFVDMQERNSAAPRPAPVAAVDGNDAVKVKNAWYVYKVSDPDTMVRLSDEVEALLNEATSSMASNIVIAMGAVQNVNDFPETSVSISFTVGIEAGASAGSTGASTNGGVSVSATSTATYASKDSILRGLRDANDKIQLSLVTRLNTMVTPTAVHPEGIALERAVSTAPYSNLAANMGAMVRTTANEKARTHFERVFPKRASRIFNYSYPTDFNRDH
ncbi:MAG: hypothetical protein OEM82_00560 [Acidobacteriota bacterium]|nr:hypothetical protein [Acidobacteriota bacterium]